MVDEKKKKKRKKQGKKIRILAPELRYHDREHKERDNWEKQNRGIENKL